jgi:guanylate kinase
VISGPSGAGKGTLIHRVMQHTPHLTCSVSATTRQPRAGEKDGKDYFFLGEQEFNAWVRGDRFLEWAEYGGHLYGTPREAVNDQLALGNDVILEIELEGARQVLDQREDAAMIFIMPPSLEELERRLRLRNTEGEDALGKRLARAEEEISDVRGKVWRGRRQFDYVIVNDSVERASEELADVIGEIRRNDEQAHD